MTFGSGAAPSVAEFDGVPFLDDTFRVRRLVSAVAAVRQVQAEQTGIEVPDEVGLWLEPEHAVRVRRNADPVPSRPLTVTQSRAVAAALDELAVLLAPCVSLLRLPVRYLCLLDTSSLSASSFWWPQHIYLGQEAFASALDVREHVLHELCHQWLYLIEELWPLQHPSAAVHTLPSGTADRTVREVIGAAHVAAVLIRLYRAATLPAHIPPLLDYGRGCLGLLDQESHHVTPTGAHIIDRLREAL